MKSNYIVKTWWSGGRRTKDSHVVRIEPEGTIATEGHMLVIVGLPEQSEQPIESRTVGSQYIAQAEKLTTKSEPMVSLAWYASPANAGMARGVKGIAGIEDHDGAFPNWRTVIPQDYADGFSINVNPKLLATLAEIFSKLLSDKAVRITFAPKNGENRAIRFDAVTNSGLPVTAVLMPMRNQDIPLHEWRKNAENIIHEPKSEV